MARTDTNPPNVVTGSGAPTQAPERVGDIYIDLLSLHSYQAVGVVDQNSWVRTDGSGGGSTIQNNLNASVDPGVTDDANAGYEVGSVWINTTADEAYRCVDATNGAAIWINTTLTTSELANVALSGAYADLSGTPTPLTLDTTYDNGQTITADAGAVRITVPNAANNVALEVFQDDITNDPYIAHFRSADGFSGNHILVEALNATTNGGYFEMYHNSASPATGDEFGIEWTANNAALTKEVTGAITVRYNDLTAGNEDSDMRFYVMKGGFSYTEVLKAGSNGVEFPWDINGHVRPAPGQDGSYSLGTGTVGWFEVGITSGGYITFSDEYFIQHDATNGWLEFGANGVPSVIASSNLENLVLRNGNATTAGIITIVGGSNGDITLDPHGTGSVVSSANILPDTDNSRNLGSTSVAFATAYVHSIRSEALAGLNILNTEGNRMLTLSYEGADANYLTINASGAGNPITIVASGTDTNISLDLIAKGTGAVQTDNNLLLKPSGVASGGNTFISNGGLNFHASWWNGAAVETKGMNWALTYESDEGAGSLYTDLTLTDSDFGDIITFNSLNIDVHRTMYHIGTVAVGRGTTNESELLVYNRAADPSGTISTGCKVYAKSGRLFIKDSNGDVGEVIASALEQTLTNKRIQSRNFTSASSSTINPDPTFYDQYNYTALAVNHTINNPLGTPVNGEKILFRYKDNGTSRTLTWGSEFRSLGASLPTATTPNKTIYIGVVYNSTDNRWDCIAVSEEA